MPLSLVGQVTKAQCMSKTVTVSVDRMVRHPKTHKLIKRTTKYLTHDPKEVLRTEDMVQIQSCPRKSRRKHFELDLILKRGWEGQQFDRAHPKKAPPILITRSALQQLEQIKRLQQLQKLDQSKENKQKRQKSLDQVEPSEQLEQSEQLKESEQSERLETSIERANASSTPGSSAA